MQLKFFATSPLWRSLRHRNYRLYLAGQLVSVCGTWMQQVALSWLRQWMGLTDEWFGEFDQDDKAKILWANCAKLFHLV